MNKQASIFTQGNRTSPGPWHVKTVGPHNKPEFQLCDFHGTPIAYLLSPNNGITVEQFKHNCNALKNTPLLLAAIAEFAYSQTAQGIDPTTALITLLKESGGVDIQAHT
jgi:hypothetical protein|tara:strand:- start:236 stop:562 length:327 start_codon:yes stop_codon:yes gene_type:complete